MSSLQDVTRSFCEALNLALKGDAEPIPCDGAVGWEASAPPTDVLEFIETVIAGLTDL